MTEFEIKSILMELGNSIDAQFNFWMATTFAIVIASYVAGHRINRACRIGIVTLYLLACAVFYSRYLQNASLIGMNIGLLRELGLETGASRIGLFALYARQLLMFTGTIFAISLVIWPKLLTKKPGESS